MKEAKSQYSNVTDGGSPLTDLPSSAMFVIPTIDPAKLPYYITVLPNDLTKYASTIYQYHGGLPDNVSNFPYTFKLTPPIATPNIVTLGVSIFKPSAPTTANGKYNLVIRDLTNGDVVVYGPTKTSFGKVDVVMGHQYRGYLTNSIGYTVNSSSFLCFSCYKSK